MKEFLTAATEAAGEAEEYLEFNVDGVLCKSYRPGDGQIAVLMATTNARHLSEGEKIAGVINFFVAVLDDETHNFLVNKLLDHKDPFGISQVQEIIEWMIEEWSARPTQSSPGSTQSQTPGGQKSTLPTQESTSSGSPAIAS